MIIHLDGNRLQEGLEGLTIEIPFSDGFKIKTLQICLSQEGLSIELEEDEPDEVIEKFSWDELLDE